MLIFILAITVISAFLFSTYGWGRLVARYSYGDSKCHWAFAAALGLACLIFSGGILNALNLAHAESLYALFGAGLVFALLDFYQRRTTKQAAQNPVASRAPADTILHIVSIIITLSVAIFLIATLIPSNAFNFHDDFFMYLVRPFYMLQTGSLGGNPYEILGIESLGTQSFLQAFILTLFPAEYVNGFDAVFCFVLSACLLIGIAKTIQAHGLYLMISLLALIIINPQTVNISPLYSGTTMMLGMFFAGALMADSSGVSETRSTFRRILPFAMFAAALISLKMTFVIIVAIYSALYFSALLSVSKDKKHVLRSGILLLAIVLLFLLPWISVYWEKYWHVFQHFMQGNTLYAAGSNELFSLYSMIIQLFSTDKLLYGGSYLGYGLIMLMLLMSGILSFYLFLKNKSASFRTYTIIVFASASAAIVSYFVNAYFFHPETALRYSCPAFIAALPFVILVLGCHMGVDNTTASRDKAKIEATRLVMTSVMIVLLIFLVTLFRDTFLERISRAYYYRTTLAFSLVDNQAYMQYNKNALSEEAGNLTRSIQDRTEKGQTLLAWISKPFHLDFARNKIYTVSELGLFNPGLDIPLTENPDDIRAYLKEQGIRYVLWEYIGEGVKSDQKLRERLNSPFPLYRKIADYNLYFRKMLLALAKKSVIMYDKNGIALFDLG